MIHPKVRTRFLPANNLTVIQRIRDTLVHCQPVLIGDTVYWERQFVLDVLALIEKEVSQ